MQIAVLGIDLGKNSCSIVGLDASGAVVLRRRMRREGIIKLAAKLKRCVVAMEACCGAHHLGRVLRAQGHEVRLMSPEYVRPYVKSQKNDDRDAEAIAEAATRPTMRFVELKSEEQLDIQTLHRARDRLVGERTALINQLRAVLLERGITIGQGRRELQHHLAGMNAEGTLSRRMFILIEDMRAQWCELDRRIAELDKGLAGWARNEEAARRLMTIPGIGVLNATALIAAIGRGRELCAWTRLGCLARSGTAAAHDRGQTASGRDQQAGQQISEISMVPEPPCRHFLRVRPHWGHGCAVCWRECTKTLPWSRWPTNLRAWPGQSYGRGRPSISLARRWRNSNWSAAHPYALIGL